MNPAMILKAAKIALAAAQSKKGRAFLFIILIVPILVIFLLSLLVCIIIIPLDTLLGYDNDNFGLRDFKNSEEVLQFSAAGNYVAIKYTREVISQGDKSIVYFNQNERPWNNMLYGFLLPISVSGCGPTTMAIVISTLTDQDLTPAEAADWSFLNGYLDQGYDKGNAYARTSHSFIPAIASNYGLICDGISKGNDTEEKINEAILNGELVVAIMGEGNFTDDGHFIILTGMTDDGNIRVTDCASRERTNQSWSINTIFNEAKDGAGAGGPFWAIYNVVEDELASEDNVEEDNTDRKKGGQP